MMRTTRRFAPDKDANGKIIQPEHQIIEGVEILSVIKISHLIGAGIEGSPCREVSEYWSMDGEFLFRESNWANERECEVTERNGIIGWNEGEVMSKEFALCVIKEIRRFYRRRKISPESTPFSCEADFESAIRMIDGLKNFIEAKALE